MIFFLKFILFYVSFKHAKRNTQQLHIIVVVHRAKRLKTSS